MAEHTKVIWDVKKYFRISFMTVRIEPWLAENASNAAQGSLDGWHTLVAQVTGDTVRYFVDGKLNAQHGGAFYPDAPCPSTSIYGLLTVL